MKRLIHRFAGMVNHAPKHERSWHHAETPNLAHHTPLPLLQRRLAMQMGMVARMQQVR